MKKSIAVLLCVNGSSSHRLDPWIVGSTDIVGPRDHSGAYSVFQTRTVPRSSSIMVIAYMSATHLFSCFSCFCTLYTCVSFRPSFQTDRPFPGVQVHYRANGQGWLTASILRDWLQWFDSTLARSVLLVSSLFTKIDLDLLNLNWVTVIPVSDKTRLSQNSAEDCDTPAGVSTPMDSVLLPLFRGCYRQATLTRLLEHMSAGKFIPTLPMRSVAEMVLSSWLGIAPCVVKRSFRCSPVCPPVLAARARNLIVSRNQKEEALQIVKDKLTHDVREYARIVRGYIFARDLGWTSTNLPPDVVPVDRFITIESESEVLHVRATESELLRSVTGAPGGNCETGTGEILTSDSFRTGFDPGFGGSLPERNLAGLGCRLSTRRLGMTSSASREVNTREEAKLSVEMLLKFFRKDPELHTEEVLYNSSALLVAITNALGRDSHSARSS
jgi:hypothetical protein